MGRRSNNSEKLLDMLFELTGGIWQVGLVISFLFAIATYISYDWALNTVANSKPTHLTAMLEQISLFYYLIPLILFLFTLVFSFRTYRAYRKEMAYNKAFKCERKLRVALTRR
mgnify:CR=1 FL=1